MVVALLALLQAQQPGIAPGPQRYRLEVTTSSEIDESSMGGPKVTGDLKTTALISVSTTDTTGGSIAVIRVDSMVIEPSGMIAQQLSASAGDSAKGATVRAYIVNGKPSGSPTVSDSTNPALASIGQALGVLFPGIRRSAKVGDTWTDTTHIDRHAGAGHQTGDVIATWTVSSASDDSTVLHGASTLKTTTADTTGQSMTLTGTSTEDVVIPASGPVLRANVETSNVLSISSPQLMIPIPGKNSGSLKLTLIP